MLLFWQTLYERIKSCRLFCAVFPPLGRESLPPRGFHLHFDWKPGLDHYRWDFGKLSFNKTLFRLPFQSYFLLRVSLTQGSSYSRYYSADQRREGYVSRVYPIQDLRESFQTYQLPSCRSMCYASNTLDGLRRCGTKSRTSTTGVALSWPTSREPCPRYPIHPTS